MREFIPRRLQSFEFLTPCLSVRVWQKTHLSKVLAVTVTNGRAWASGWEPARDNALRARVLPLSLAAQAWPSGWTRVQRPRGRGAPWSEALLQRSPPGLRGASPGCSQRARVSAPPHSPGPEPPAERGPSDSADTGQPCRSEQGGKREWGVPGTFLQHTDHLSESRSYEWKMDMVIKNKSGTNLYTWTRVFGRRFPAWVPFLFIKAFILYWSATT